MTQIWVSWVILSRGYFEYWFRSVMRPAVCKAHNILKSSPARALKDEGVGRRSSFEDICVWYERYPTRVFSLIFSYHYTTCFNSTNIPSRHMQNVSRACRLVVLNVALSYPVLLVFLSQCFSIHPKSAPQPPASLPRRIFSFLHAKSMSCSCWRHLPTAADALSLHSTPSHRRRRPKPSESGGR